MTLDDEARALVAEREELLTVKQYADLFQVTSTAVYTAVRHGRCQYPVERPTGGAIRIRVPATLIAKLRAA